MADSEDRQIRTGIEELDREIDGGFRDGSIIAFVAPPDSQSEVFFEQIADKHASVLFSTLRSEDQITDTFQAHGVDTEHQFRPRFIGEASNPLTAIKNGVETVSQEASAIIVDPLNPIEWNYSADEYASSFRKMSDAIQESGTILFLHCHAAESPPTLRNLTLSLADVVIQFDQDREGEEMTTRLYLPKYRGGSPLSESIKLDITDEIAVDTSREIA